MSLIAACFLCVALMQAEPAADSAASLERFLQEAQGYEMRLGDRNKSQLELLKQPLLHWNNTLNSENGAVYVWLHEGRPEVIGTIFTLKRVSTGEIITKHSLHSLSSSGIVAEHRGQKVWAPVTRGVEFRPIAEAPEPADTARFRLIQMKAIAKDFSGKIIDLKGNSSELRLMPQPLVRYEPSRADVQDGAIFALAEGTDPQALVLIEARKSDGAWRWEAGFARFHFVTLFGYHKEQEVWHVDPDPSQTKSLLGAPEQFAKIYISLQKK